MKKALILGISGQDGSYLSEYLLNLGYEVHGSLRRHSVSENQDSRISKLNIHAHYCDITDDLSLSNLIKNIQADEIYNLAAMSHVRVSFDIPNFTIQTNGLAVLSLLEIVKNYSSHSKVYQASSSEMFGNSVDKYGYQRLNTPMVPASP
jgi:GDPmannose 4,6-dehydratase